MSNQIVISSGAKVRSLEGVLTGTAGIVNSVPLGGANGVATLDSNGKVPLSQLPASVVTYLGTWNAATNTPTLTNGTGDIGDLYICNVAGTVNFGAGPITFAVGDWVIYNGSQWQKSAGASGTVTSVAVTSTGNDAISITGSPITTVGTINIGFTGTSAQYVNGAGDLTTFPSLTGYVPYTGATTDVDLGVHVLNAQALHVKGTAGAGHLGLKHQSAAATGSANESLIYANVDGDLAWQNDNLYLTTLSTHANTANRVYTFPDLTGTMAMLEGTQTFSGSKTFSATTLLNNIYVDGVSYLKTQTTTSYIAGYTTFSAKANGVIEYYFPSSFKSILDFNDGGDYTYTFPNLSGTIALLEGTQTFTGDKTFNGGVDFNNAININNTFNLRNNLVGSTLYTNFSILKSGSLETLSLLFSTANSSKLVFNDAANYTYTFPASSGTLALTSNLSSYVPYTGATTDVDLGVYKISSRSLITTGTTNGGVLLKQNSVISGEVDSQPYTSIKAFDTRYLYFDFGTATSYKRFRFDANGLTDGTTITYTMPNASGTLALTSDIPSLANYVTTNTNQTISGIKTFSNEQLFGNGITLTGGYITYTSGSFNLTLNTNILTANRNVFLQDKAGTIALTSDLTGGTVTSVGLSSSTSGVTIGSSPITTSGTITLAIATASGSQQGLLSSTDWTTFNNKQNALTNPVTGTGTTNYHAKFTSSNVVGNSLIFDDGTNVGIGTNAPFSGIGYAQGLQVKSASNNAFIRANSGSYIGVDLLQQTDGNAALWNRDNGYIQVGTNNTARLTFEAAGNIKIETNNVALTQKNAAGTGTVGLLRLGSDNKIQIGDGGTINPVTTYIPTGGLGIGTSSVSALLHIYGGANDFEIQMQNGNGSAYFQLRNGATGFRPANCIGIVNGISNASVALQAATGGDIRFGINTTESMRITSGGDVLIGQTTASGSVNGIYLRSGQDSGMIATSDSALSLTRLSTNGKILRFFYAGSEVGSISTNTNSLPSDLNFKKDITDMSLGLNLVNKLRPVHYRHKMDNEDEPLSNGIIAQELEEALLECGIEKNTLLMLQHKPTEDKNQSEYWVDYIKIIPILINSIQELSAKVTALENK